MRDPQRFTAWLVGITRQVCREWRRGRFLLRQRTTLLTDAAAEAVREDPPDERVALLRDAVGALPQRERLSVQAFYLQGLDADAACAALAVSRATLYRVLSGARERLRRVLSRQEVRP